MAYLYPYGDTQQLNLDWLIEQWNEVKSQIDGSLQAEIDKVEAAITELLEARDDAIAAQAAAQASAQAAAGSASTASGAAMTATAQAQAAAGSAATAGAHASDAQGYAATAQQSAQAANNSASAAAVSEGNARNSETAAAGSSSAAAGNALYSEGYAKGTQNGNPVSSSSPYYHNNAKYFSDQAAQEAQDAADSAQDAHDVLDSIPADYTQLNNDVIELQTAINVMSPILKSAAFAWTIGKTINNSGTIINTAATAMTTDIQTVNGGDIVVNKSNEYGMNSKATIFYVSQYIGDTWQKRTQVATGNSLTLDNTTTGIRIVFGYAGSAGNTETQEDVDANFACQIFTESAREIDLNEVIANVEKAITTDYKEATVIPSNTDYNTLLTIGNYYCASNTSAQTMTNCPVEFSHRLIVLSTTNANSITQIIITNATARDIYIRGLYNGTPDAWHRLVNADETVLTYPYHITGSSQTTITDLDDVEPNTVYTINGNVNIANMPKGNNNVAGAGADYGTPDGSLITFKGATFNNGTALAQLFFGQSGGDFAEPIIDFRTKYYSQGAWQWSPWAQLAGLFGVVRATNTFIQESRIQAGTADFDDMDNAPNNTIYQIDLDAVSMAHNPLSGNSCVLVSLSPSFTSQHGTLQLCGGIKNGDAHLFFRYGFRQDANTFVWKPWREVTSTAVT